MGYHHFSNDCHEHHALVLNGHPAQVLAAVHAERGLQDARWGEQNHPDGTGNLKLLLHGGGSVNLDLRTGAELADHFRNLCDKRHKSGNGSWTDILLEELFEALAESNPAKLRAELIQVAAVAVAWVEAIDRRTKTSNGFRFTDSHTGKVIES